MKKNEENIIRIRKSELKKCMVLTATLVTVSTAAITSMVVGIARNSHQRKLGAEYIAKQIEESGIIPNFDDFDIYVSANGEVEFYDEEVVFDDSEMGYPVGRSTRVKVDTGELMNNILKNGNSLGYSDAAIEIYFDESEFSVLSDYINASSDEKNALKEQSYYLYMAERIGKGEGKRNGK